MAAASITRRLTLLFVVVSASVLLALGFVIASLVEQHFEEQDLDVLASKMDVTRHTLSMWRSPGDLELVTQLLYNSLMTEHEIEMVVFAGNRDVVFATPNAGFAFDLVLRSVTPARYRPAIWSIGAQSYRGIAAVVPISADPGSDLVVAVALNMAHHQAFMRSFRKSLWLFMAVAAALTGLLGWIAVRRGLAPLRAMREQARVVTAHQLSVRLPVDSVPLELAELAQSLNEMLARLEDAFHRISAFSSDIAHELRTPVSNLMTQTQVALSRARSADEYRNILELNSEEFEHMSRMISDMLLLARAENDLVVPNRETVSLAQQALALFEYYDAVAEEKGLQLQLEGDAEVHADRLMLRRALGNLLSNAVRHATPGSAVRITIGADSEAISIDVENHGDTIPHEYLERVFDRFFRVDPSRQRNSEGTGLGMAITKSIVQAHGGTIRAASSNGVTTFSIRLPHPG